MYKMEQKLMEQKYKVEKMEHKKGTKVRNVFITINHHTTNEINILKSLKYKYCLIGEHIGEKSKINHIHALLEFNNPVSWWGIKKKLNRARIESRKGTALQCYKYINKDNKILYKDGTPSKQGSKFVDIKDDIKDGAELKDIVENYPEEFIKYHNGIEKTMDILQKDLHHSTMLKKYDNVQ